MAGQGERGDGRLDAARYRIARMARDDGADVRASGEAVAPDDADANNAEVDVDRRQDPETDAGQSMMEARAHFVEIAIQQSMRRGDFDNLPGAGKPLADLAHNDPDWWIKRKLQRENITGLGPPALTLRTEDAQLDARLDSCHTLQAVREVLDDFNARVIEARRQLQGGPPVVTPVRDVDEEIRRWGDRRAERARALAAQQEETATARRTMTWRERRRAR
jgi:hypothetical protein